MSRAKFLHSSFTFPLLINYLFVLAFGTTSLLREALAKHLVSKIQIQSLSYGWELE